MKEDVSDWCRQCKDCQERRRPHKAPQAPMQQYLVGAPMERIALDILGPLPETHDGNRYVLVVGDYFSKWTDAYAMPDIETSTIVDILVNKVICLWGMPLHIHSDQGTQFESQLFKELCACLGITKTRTTAYFPQSDGMIERFNQTVEEMLSKYISEDQRDWDRYLPLMMLAYRTSTHDSTGFSPSLLFMGREPRTPLDMLVGTPPQESPTISYPDYVTNMRTKMHQVHELARDKLMAASDRQKRNYDHRESRHDYKPGDAVMLKVMRHKKRISPKLVKKRWDGPFLVLRLVADFVYEIQRTPQSKKLVVNHNRLKPFEGPYENWLNKEPEDNADARLSDDDLPPPEMADADQEMSDIVSSSSSDETSSDEEAEPPVVTRAGRSVRPPQYLADYTVDS